MEIGVPYIAVAGGPKATIRKGDHLRKESNGDILVKEASGWLHREDCRRLKTLVQVDVDMLRVRMEEAKQRYENAKQQYEEMLVPEEV